MANKGNKKLIKDAFIVNEGKTFKGDVFIDGSQIKFITTGASKPDFDTSTFEIINAEGLYLLPGLIDDQVHFRDPGLTYKADLYTES